MMQRRRFDDIGLCVTGKALDGRSLRLGEQEKKRRADPIATGSAILEAEFGGA